MNPAIPTESGNCFLDRLLALNKREPVAQGGGIAILPPCENSLSRNVQRKPL